MYDIAVPVAACLRAGTRVEVAWAVETHGFGSRDGTEALMLTPGGGRVGSVLSGSVDARLAGLAGTAVVGDTVITVLWPVPKLVIIGAGAIAEALAATAALLGWSTRTMTDADEAGTVLAELTALDNVVVISHDAEIAGRALMAVLSGGAGYIGALGSRRTEQARAGWLADHGITELDRIHGPAGLDIGAGTPAEIAVSIVAEALAVRSGSGATSLRSRAGSIHASAPDPI